MKRRQLMGYAGTGLLAAVGTGLLVQLSPAQAQATGLKIQWLGHTSFLFTGSGQRILVNPFRTLGCTAGYRLPKVQTDLVLISSQLLDEGAVEILPGNPRLLYEAGVYQVGDLRIQGIRTDHDRIGGKRFGTNVVWQWKQGGLNILHLGGAAAPITLEQKILMGQPDVLLIPVGNGPKAYSPEEAKQAIALLQPKLVIPTHYRTQAADPETCDLVGLDQFLTLMQGTPVKRANSDTVTLTPGSLPKRGPEILVMSYSYPPAPKKPGAPAKKAPAGQSPAPTPSPTPTPSPGNK
ncbi:MAG: MBL fold metallo-hydrolase [Leptolyngbyaceae cyanobacterium]